MQSPWGCCNFKIFVILQDLLRIGVVALGPRKKIVHALNELRQKNNCGQGTETIITTNENTKQSLQGNKLITEFFQGPHIDRSGPRSLNNIQRGKEKTSKDPVNQRVGSRSHIGQGKVRDIPRWCCIPGTPFRVVWYIIFLSK